MIGKKRIGSKLLSAFLSGTILVSSLGITTFADSLATERMFLELHPWKILYMKQTHQKH